MYQLGGVVRQQAVYLHYVRWVARRKPALASGVRPGTYRPSTWITTGLCNCPACSNSAIFHVQGLICYHTPVSYGQVFSLSCCMYCTLLCSLTERNDCTSSLRTCGCMSSCMQTCCPLSDLTFCKLLLLCLLDLSCKVLQAGCVKVWSCSC